MSAHPPWKKLAAVPLGLAGFGLCVNPVAARSKAPRASRPTIQTTNASADNSSQAEFPQPGNSGPANAAPEKAGQGPGNSEPAGPDNVVRLNTDGTFKVVVRTVDGQVVGPSQVTLVPTEPQQVDAVQFVIGQRGESLVSGVKPATYRVQVAADRYAYDGTLQVSSATTARAGTPKVVVFPVQFTQPDPPAPLPEPVPQQPAGGFVPGASTRSLIMAGLGGAAVATAIAVPIAVTTYNSKDTSPPAPASP